MINYVNCKIIPNKTLFFFRKDIFITMKPTVVLHKYSHTSVNKSYRIEYN